MKRILFCLAAALAFLLLFSPKLAGTQPADRVMFDAVISNQKVLALVAFDTALAESGARVGLPPGTLDGIRQDFKAHFANRIVALPEWRNHILLQCYRFDVPYSVAREWVGQLRELVPSRVDVDFLQLIRRVNLDGDEVHELRGREPTLPKILAPLALQQPLPSYTQAARDDRIEGTILLQADVLKDGTVANVRVTRPLGYGLDEAAVLTVLERWQFRPAQLEGQPVSVRANIEVAFKLY